MSNFLIYSKDYDHSFDSLKVWLLFPTVKWMENEFDELGYPKTTISIDLATKAELIQSKDFWSSSLILFGFGISISRQIGY